MTFPPALPSVHVRGHALLPWRLVGLPGDDPGVSRSRSGRISVFLEPGVISVTRVDDPDDRENENQQEYPYDHLIRFHFHVFLLLSLLR
jgi:hypothetical protein